ncbi:MAG: hypothetical protein AAF660_13310 [Pseudomonadota bacterium]
MRALSLVMICLLAGCAAGLQLPSPSRDFPDDVSFAGDWKRSEFREQDEMEPDRLNLPSTREPTPSVSNTRARPGRKVRSFLEFGRELRITQLDTAILISFDRALVREYRFGEHRMTNVGPIVAERTTGFRGKVLEIVTQDDDGAVMTESWRLQRSDRQLERSVVIVKGNKQLYRLRETYRREAS